MYLRVTPKGVKTFSFLARAKGAKRVERLTIGKFPTIKPDEARRQATELAGRIAGGVNVAAASREKRGEMALAQVHKLYSEHLSRRGKKTDSLKYLWEPYIEPAFGLSEISALDLERWYNAVPAQIVARREAEEAARKATQLARREAIASRQAVRRHGPDPAKRVDTSHLSTAAITGNVTANNAVGYVRAMSNFALDPKHQYFASVNPASHAFMFRQDDRERFLQPGEMAQFFEAER